MNKLRSCSGLTLSVLPRLDGERKACVLQFLYETDLITKDPSVVDLLGADLGEANLNGANLSGTDLRGVDLNGANLREADLH
ncbi:MAG: Pentapeptide repeat family protein [uncultured Rubrobacteraceae bacterium]|uniref:Pentapeptide repeat family protein n=1 Tax=uncultured Rubrobacteraceae bacterium TaxID=349277 RepID=A0A6J4R590_9ACTN|nr:MAG: Pentapeptide repeat family protein [uncultured Rubrobacteraceae bacterium]